MTDGSRTLGPAAVDDRSRVGSPCLGWSHGGLTDYKNLFIFSIRFFFLLFESGMWAMMERNPLFCASNLRDLGGLEVKFWDEFMFELVR